MACISTTSTATATTTTTTTAAAKRVEHSSIYSSAVASQFIQQLRAVRIPHVQLPVATAARDHCAVGGPVAAQEGLVGCVRMPGENPHVPRMSLPLPLLPLTTAAADSCNKGAHIPHAKSVVHCITQQIAAIRTQLQTCDSVRVAL